MSHDMANAKTTNTKITATQLPQVFLPVRKVKRVPGGYRVLELKSREQDFWIAVSKVYAHSTSAFAALGRLTQKQTKELYSEDGKLQDA